MEESGHYYHRLRGAQRREYTALVQTPHVLVNDEEGVLVSFRIWKDLSKAKAWRKAAGYAERLGKLQQVITKFEPRTLQQVGEA